jgi:hypothetical protein
VPVDPVPDVRGGGEGDGRRGGRRGRRRAVARVVTVSAMPATGVGAAGTTMGEVLDVAGAEPSLAS